MPVPPENLADMLYAMDIRPKHMTPGHTEHLTCPTCGGGRTRETSFALTIDDDGQGATWICHRGSCAWTGGKRVSGHDRSHTEPKARVIKRPEVHPAEVTNQRPGWFDAMMDYRCFGERTIKAFGLYALHEKWFPNPIGNSACLVFSYLFKGDLVNRKYRAFPNKAFIQDADTEPTLFNVDRLGESPEEVIFVEGEMDVLATFECGKDNAVSLRDGAPKEATFKPDDKRFEALRTHADMLGKVKRFVLAGDTDAPGIALREELARRLGRHRCWLATWPEGCKDASDTLRLNGPDAVLDVLRNAAPYPIAGIQQIGPGTLLALRLRPAPTTMTTGTRATDAVVHLPTEGRLIVVTGFPGSGKTTWTRFIMVHTSEHHARRWAVFSPEMQPWEHFVVDCAEAHIGKPFYPKAGVAPMSDEEAMEAEAWFRDKLTMIVSDAEAEAPTLDWLLEKFKIAVLRNGITDALIDPWNEISQQRGAMSETDYIGLALQRLKAFGLRYGVNMWIVVHPAKPQQPPRSGVKHLAPGPYDIAGSANWANKTDLGITIHSPEPGGAEMHLWKSRFFRWGVKGKVAPMDFDQITGRYSTPIPDLLQ